VKVINNIEIVIVIGINKNIICLLSYNCDNHIIQDLLRSIIFDYN